MFRKFALVAAMLCATPVFAQDAGFSASTENGTFTTTNDVVNAMIVDWGNYDTACRGSSPSAAEGFCGARDYIGWALGESGVCLNDEATGSRWEVCAADSYAAADPLADIREDL